MRSFGKYHDLPTAEESYLDGYETGRKWDARWIPGGPAVTGLRDWERTSADQSWINFCEATIENNQEWMRGWEEARQGLPCWWVRHLDAIAVLGYN